MKAKPEIPNGWRRVRRGFIKTGDRIFCPVDFTWDAVVKNATNFLNQPLTSLPVRAAAYVIRKR